MINDLNTQTNYDKPAPKIPDSIFLLLQEMAKEFATQDERSIKDGLAVLNKNLNTLNANEVECLVVGMNKIYNISLENEKKLNEENTDRTFISFLLKLFV
jgi:hypothetical protein